MAGILEYIRSKFQPICHISHLSLTATHLTAAAATHLAAAAIHLAASAATHLTAAAATHLAAAAATHLAAAACISSFNYTDLQAYINYIHVSSFYKATSLNFNYACKGERWTWKRKESCQT